jgi:hypothetical protein
MLTQNKRLVGILVTVTVLLLMPLIAMQFNTGVNWTLSDFFIAGILLFGTGLLCEFILRKVKTIKYRILICGIILFALALVWAELAVGLFGTRFAGS